MKVRRCVGLLWSVLFAGCSAAQQHAAFNPVSDGSRLHTVKKVEASVTILVPKRRHHRRYPTYVSPATRSLSIVVVSSTSGVTVENTVVNLTPSSSGCGASSQGTICTISVFLPPGSYTGTLTAYDQLNGQGAALSEGQNVPFTLVAEQNNQIAITLDGVPASIRVTPTSSAISGSTASGFIIGPSGEWANAQTFAVNVLDANGYVIVGPGSPGVSMSSSSGAFTVGSPSGSTPNLFSVSPPTGAVSATTQLTVGLTPPNAAICQIASASCSTTFNLQYAPFANDDWVTFAHDFQRTGMQPQDTGITTSTVSQLTSRWQVHLNRTFIASPLVYDGNVILVDASGRLYDLSAATGQILWQRGISAGVLATPTIDVKDGLLFVGTYSNPDNPGKGQTGPEGPSTLYAFRLSDGSIVWQQVVPGVIRSAPVYANGVVYEANAGGDAYAACTNGGLFAFNATSGALLWNWLTNPFTNPGGGGGVWGALAWDGSHVIFGTGNTCQAVFDMQGAAALNTDGSLAWSFSAEPTILGDYDTGGGVMVHNGTATFINKNGSLYSLDLDNGTRVLATPLGATSDHGGFASPATDGSIVVVGAGSLGSGSPLARRTEFCKAPDMRAMRRGVVTEGRALAGFTSALKAVDATGTIIWSVPMSNVLIGYTAVNNGIVYAGLDMGSVHAIEAIDIQDGTVLAQLQEANTFTASPVIVPSGLYGVDVSGDVYAFALPAGSDTAVR